MTLSRSLLAIAWLGACTAGPVSAQRFDATGPGAPRDMRPVSCPAADSLAGHPLARPSAPGFGWHEGTSNNFVSNGIYVPNATKPLDVILLTANSEGGGVQPDPTFGLQIRMQDTLLRQDASATLLLTIDDSTRFTIGNMDAVSTPMSRGRKVDQVLTIGVPRGAARRIGGATTIAGTIGGTSFNVPPKAIEAFRSVFIAAVCGTHL